MRVEAWRNGVLVAVEDVPVPVEVRRADIFNALAGIDMKSIRAIREGDAARIAQWEQEASALRAELAALAG